MSVQKITPLRRVRAPSSVAARPDLPFDLPVRLRRNRTSGNMRALLRENALTPQDLILPVFVEEHASERQPVEAMPGVYRETENSLADLVKSAQKENIPAVMLFGVSHHKDECGTDSMRPGGLLDRMIRRAKDAAPDMLVIADICFCEYTDHGHCGVMHAHKHTVDNDRTLQNIGQQAFIAAEAGADILAPSGMMDGMVAMIRHTLDTAGHEDIPIMSYAAKFASAFYGPFRAAAGCGLSEGEDRKTYQMDPANAHEALREVEQDVLEGADMLIVKPGLAYLDIVAKVKEAFAMPTFSYHVSGEYAMLRAAEEKGWIDYDTVLMETLLSFKRAGADGILSYGSIDAARTLNNL